MKKLTNVLQKNFALLVVLGLVTVLSSCANYSTKSKDGVTISYSAKGKGPLAIVFVHGWSCDKSYWSEQEDYFSDKYRVISIDLAGHGDSTLERENYTMDLYGEDVAAVINKENPAKVILVGHSMGGAVIMHAANKIQSNVLGLIGADTYQYFAHKMTKKQKKMFVDPLKKNFKEGANVFVRRMFPKNADQDLVNKIASDMSEQPANVAISSMENLINGNPLKIVRTIKVPVKAVNADFWPTNVPGNRRYIKSFDAKIMKGVGHFVAQERPDEFNKYLQEFINELNN